MGVFAPGGIELQANVGSLAVPVWVPLRESTASLRWSDASSRSLTEGFYGWPAVTRPASAGGVPYLYAFTNVAVGHGVLGGGLSLPPATWTRAQYLQLRFRWGNSGSFAEAPRISAYYSTTNLSAFRRGDGSVLGGSDDTLAGATRFSYLKAALYGGGLSGAAPTAAPAADPLLTSGTVGVVRPTTGAWSAWQALNGDLDWLEPEVTPQSSEPDTYLYLIARLFSGPGMIAHAGSGPFPYTVHAPSITLRYRPG